MWSAKLYDKFKKERLQPSIDLLNKVELTECKRIIDIGCGSGMSTLPLRKRFPEASIVGVDLSENMLGQASKLLDDVEWIKRDCSKKLTNLGTFDLVFSNAFLQWLQNQEEFVKNTKELLNTNGVLAIQIPSFEEMVISRIIKDTAKEFDINSEFFLNIDQTNCRNHTLGEYYDMFSRYFTDIEIWKTNYFHQMKDHASILEFVKATALLPYLKQLDHNQVEMFMELLYSNTKKQYLESENKTVLFEFKRIFIIAKNV